MKTTYLYGAMALGLLFTACKSDDLTIPDNNVMEADQTFYVAMKINGDIPVGTRATTDTGSSDNGNPNADKTNEDGSFTDFEMGSETENENGVNNAYFVFYDANGQVVGNIVPSELGSPSGAIDGQTVEKYYKSVVPVSVRKGEMKPIQVICYINPISPATLQNPLNVIQTVAREQVFTNIGTTKYFAMSNSVYYPEGETSNSLPGIAVPISNDILYETEKQAEDAIKELDLNKPETLSKVVNIYVERYASRLKFDATQATNTPYVGGTRTYTPDESGVIKAETGKVELTFTPLYWAVNAESTTTYVIKSFRQESELGQILADNYSYGMLNQRINPNTYDTNNNSWTYGEGAGALTSTSGWWDWNNPAYHRSYWAISPAYFTNEYPEVSEDLKGITVNQKYLKFNELENLGYSASNTTPQYFKETTVGTKALASNNPAAAMPSVIFVGKYSLKVDGTTVTIPEGKGFYTYLSGPVDGEDNDKAYIYFDNKVTGDNMNQIESVAVGANTTSMLQRFLAQSTVLYKAVTVDGKTTYERYTIADSEDVNKLINFLSVSEISASVKDAAVTGNTGKYSALKLQSNARSLQFTSIPTSDDNIWIATADGYRQIVADDTENIATNQITLSKANATLMQQVGYAFYYLNGEGYYNIPVKHLGWYRTANAQKDSKKIDWKQVRVGDFGMVRNHAYEINVSSITGLASGIGGNDVEIVPPATTEDYFVAYTVRILKWAVVPIQHVEL